MLSALAWVPRGAARAVPLTAEAFEADADGRWAREPEAAAAAERLEADGERSDSADEMEEAGADAEERDGGGQRGQAAGGKRQEVSSVERAAAAAAALKQRAKEERAEIERRRKGVRESTGDDDSDGDDVAMGDRSLEEAMAELDMENYDEEDEQGEGREGGAVPNLFGGGSGIGGAYYLSNDEDPYITLPDEEDEAEEEERDDLTIRPSDLLLLAARNEDDVSFVEVWLCAEEEVEVEEGEGEGEGQAAGSGSAEGSRRSGQRRTLRDWHLYVHHDVMLPAYPLALAWMSFHPAAAASAGSAPAAPSGAAGGGNLVAVASMDPGIEVWDLDVLDSVEPVAVLGGEERAGGGTPGLGTARRKAGEGEGAAEKAGRGKQWQGVRVGGKKAASGRAGKLKAAASGGKPRLREGSHAGAVLSLAWHAAVRSALASGGEDASVRLWDLAAQRCVLCLPRGQLHSDKVQALAWRAAAGASAGSGAEAGAESQLLTGSFDGSCALVDVRRPASPALKWQLSADCEALTWHPHDPNCFSVSAEDGTVVCHDVRGGSAASSALWTLSAHSKAACALSFSPCPALRSLLATGSTDKTVRLWDTRGGQPSLLHTARPQLGAVFSLGFCADEPQLLAMGGSKGTLAVWDVGQEPCVRQWGHKQGD